MPAAGRATRLAPLPCSKELYPIGFRPTDPSGSLRPKVVCHYLLEKMRLAEIKKVYVILRNGKWDLPGYLGDGQMLDMHLAYLMMGSPLGVPFTLDQAFPFVQDAVVALGFPDILFQPEDAYARLLKRQMESGADVVLGLFPAPQPDKMDMVDLDSDGCIRAIQIKPVSTDLRYTWIIAVWNARFTHFMHSHLAASQPGNRHDAGDWETGAQPEMQVSEVIQAAIRKGLHIDSIVFGEGRCLDVGTPDALVRAVQMAGRTPEGLL